MAILTSKQRLTQDAVKTYVINLITSTVGFGFASNDLVRDAIYCKNNVGQSNDIYCGFKGALIFYAIPTIISNVLKPYMIDTAYQQNSNVATICTKDDVATDITTLVEAYGQNLIRNFCSYISSAYSSADISSLCSDPPYSNNILPIQISQTQAIQYLNFVHELTQRSLVNDITYLKVINDAECSWGNPAAITYSLSDMTSLNSAFHICPSICTADSLSIFMWYLTAARFLSSTDLSLGYAKPLMINTYSDVIAEWEKSTGSCMLSQNNKLEPYCLAVFYMPDITGNIISWGGCYDC